MIPNKHNRVMSNERRLNPGGKPKSKFEKRKDSARDEARRAAELEKARNNLAEGLDQYIKFLTDKTLPENRTMGDRDTQTKVLNGLPKLATELNKRNIEEGSMVIASTCLNSILVLRDEINKLRYQNYFLNKKVDELTEKLDAPKAEEKPEEQEVESPE